MGKTKCSYHPLRQARRDELIQAGELPMVKDKKKKQQEGGSKGSKGAKVEGKKRKRRVNNEDSMEDDSEADGGTVAGASTPRPPSVPRALPAARRAPVAPSTGRSVPPPIAPAVSNLNVVKTTRVPTIAGLQREVHDLKTLISNLTNGQQELRQDNLMLRGWFEVLLPLKEKMMVDVPVLQAEMRGLTDAMELEKLKSEIKMLRPQLRQANARLSQLEVETTSEEDEEDDKDVDHQPQDQRTTLKIQLPKSSMFVNPAQSRHSIRRSLSPPTAGPSSIRFNLN
jgi:hypothetical protein